jgi:hypothetical protein
LRCYALFIQQLWNAVALREAVAFARDSAHTGYALDENDYCDVKALCEHFGITMPLEYEEFEKNCR